MAPTQPCAKYQYVLTPAGPKILPVPETHSKDEESPADYNQGGYLQVRLRDSFKDGRYTVLRKLGWGHFSTVWLVKDNIENRHSALKVVKSASRYAETARDEIKLLRQVMAANPLHSGRDHVVSFLDSFTHSVAPSLPPSQQYGSISQTGAATNPDVHICIVFEPLGENLLALIERHKTTGVPVPLVKVITKQVLLGLQYLHDECELVHTDIKPENIMISIPDVESHIETQLTIAPQPTSRKVGVPPKGTRTGVAIPKRTANSLSVNTASARQVQIFDSQPLLSPSSSSSWSSKSLFLGLTRLRDGADSASAAGSACPSKVGSFVGTTGPLGLSSLSQSTSKAKPVPVPTPVDDPRVKKPSTLDSVISQTESEISCASSSGLSAGAPCSTPPSSVGSLAGAFEKMMGGAKGGRAKEQSKGVGMKREAQTGGKSVLGLQRVSAAKTIEKELEEAQCTCMFEMDAEGEVGTGFAVHDVIDDHHHDDAVNKLRALQSQSVKRRVPLPLAPSRPSLLSQTAPTDVHMHNHRSQCSTHLHQSPSSANNHSHSHSHSHSNVHSHTHSPQAASAVTAPPPSLLLSVPRPAAAAASASPSSSPTSSLPSPGVPDLCRSPTPGSSSSPTPSASVLPAAPISIKIADLGNATPVRAHYTEDIQTRQYRAPEAITGRADWGGTADVWSLACVVFELLTAEYLFDPQSQGELFGKDDDHCAQIIELLGPWPESVRAGGRFSRDIFDSNGNLRYIRNLKPWPLKRVMTEKYGWREAEADALCEFLLPMLRVDHFARCTARELLDHPWLDVDTDLELQRVDSW